MVDPALYVQDNDLDELTLDNRTFVDIGSINATASYVDNDGTVPIIRHIIPPNPDAFRNCPPIEVGVSLPYVPS